MTLSHNEKIELQELRKDKSEYLRQISKLTAEKRALKIEVNCLRAEVSGRLSDEEIVQLTITRLKEGLPQSIQKGDKKQ
jgi:hypothetical protein